MSPFAKPVYRFTTKSPLVVLSNEESLVRCSAGFALFHAVNRFPDVATQGLLVRVKFPETVNVVKDANRVRIGCMDSCLLWLGTIIASQPIARATKETYAQQGVTPLMVEGKETNLSTD